MFMLEHLTIICQCAGVKFTAIETSNDNHDSLINSLAASDVLKREYWVYKYRVCPIPWHSFRLCRLLSFVKTLNIKRNGQICMKELRTVTIQGQTKKNHVNSNGMNLQNENTKTRTFRRQSHAWSKPIQVKSMYEYSNSNSNSYIFEWKLVEYKMAFYLWLWSVRCLCICCCYLLAW